MAGFFPLFFKQYWAAGVDSSHSTFMLGAINALASLLVVLLAPLLGAIADKSSSRKRFLLYFTLMGVVMTGSLFLVEQGGWLLAVILFGLAVFGFSGSNIFYDSLLLQVAKEDEFDTVSALGYAFGYLGGGLLFALNVLMTLYPVAFGLADAATAVRVSFLMVAIWWGLFTIPLLLFVDEPGLPADSWRVHLQGGVARIRTTLREIRALRQLFIFLIAYWLYIDGVGTIVRMAVDYGLSLGFASNNLIVALLITQLIGFPAALLFGHIGQRYGSRSGIILAITVYLLVIIWAYQMSSVWEFYLLAGVIGLVQGGIQSLSRSFYARLVPAGKSGEFFGFFNMLGKFATVIGPLLMGGVSVMTGSPRLSILSVALLFILGVVALLLVDEAEGRRQARAY